MTEKPTTPTTESTMTEKLKGDGPINLDKNEAAELRATIRAVFERDNQLLLQLAQLEATNQVNISMAEALKRQGFIMKSEPQPDGSVAWDLQNAPPPVTDAPTLN